MQTFMGTVLLMLGIVAVTIGVLLITMPNKPDYSKLVPESEWYIDASDPFKDKITVVKVLAVKDGWIKFVYKKDDGTYYDESLFTVDGCESFLRIYKPLKEKSFANPRRKS